MLGRRCTFLLFLAQDTFSSRRLPIYLLKHSHSIENLSSLSLKMAIMLRLNVFLLNLLLFQYFIFLKKNQLLEQVNAIINDFTENLIMIKRKYIKLYKLKVIKIIIAYEMFVFFQELFETYLYAFSWFEHFSSHIVLLIT